MPEITEILRPHPPTQILAYATDHDRIYQRLRMYKKLSGIKETLLSVYTSLIFATIK